MAGMDGGDINFSSHMLDDLGNGSSMESFFEEILRDTTHACTHTHTCNPPGPDNTHTHTCFHTHTKILAAPDGEKSADTAESPQNSSSKPKKRPVGNREAVRKYREKKKARTASLEEEVSQLTSLNQQLIRRLQGQAALEAEIARLKCLLADFRGRIDGELGSYPYQKSIRMDKTCNDAPFRQPMPGGYVLDPCNIWCNADAACHDPALASNSEGGVQHEHDSGARWKGECGQMSGHCQGLKGDMAVTTSGLSACSEGTATKTVPATVASSGKERKGTFGV